jgi:membrane protein implicated in regulation of membrane protease activity
VRVFFFLALILLLALPHPWNLVGFVVSLVLFVGEVLFWNRTVRRRRAAVGADTLIGKNAVVLSACRPDGQVRLSGEIWEARCAGGADPGDTVRVVGREGLKLLVERPA